MIKIDYDANPCVFDLNFILKAYIPETYFGMSDVEPAELNFYVDLLRQNNILPKGYSPVPITWSLHYACVLDGMPFVMTYDEDYDFVRFAVGHPDDRVKIAETIRKLVENNLLSDV